MPLRSIALHAESESASYGSVSVLKKKIRRAGAQKRIKNMKRLNAVVRVAVCLATIFAMVFLSQAESRDKRLSTTQQTETSATEIHLVDQTGRPAVSGVPSTP